VQSLDKRREAETEKFNIKKGLNTILESTAGWLNGRQEFKIPDYTREVKKVQTLVDSCKIKLKSNKVEAIPHFNEIISRELDAVVETLTKIDHFHASARCARAALELTMVNLYRYFHPGGRLLNGSFLEKYGVKGLTHKTRSPILELVRDGILDEIEFGLFRESYSYLSSYVHYRITYELCHTLPTKIKSKQYYAEVLRLAVKKGRIARIVKATLIKGSLVPALETLNMLLKSYKRVR